MHRLYDSLPLRLMICFALLLITCCFANLRHGYSMLKYGHKLDRRMITSYDKFSILDCVEDCLRTTRCRSINYHQGAHFCQTNFETNVSSLELYLEKPGWIYSSRSDWDKNGNECYCGTQVRFSPKVLSFNECNKPCSGNAVETCGAAWKMEIYPI
uniref:Apple domain-containing protein n=1 Tax=Magallana gigas TaxID=29159 RepID=A0A8W8P1F8_MAGGI